MNCEALFSSFLAVTNRLWGADLPLEVIRWICSLIDFSPRNKTGLRSDIYS